MLAALTVLKERLRVFEHRTEPLLPKAQYYRRVLGYAGMAFVFILVALFIGILGYHGFEGQSWVDALLNASMILGGMGPINPLHTVGGKVFASVYALFSGIVFLVAVGTLFAPIFHRFLHHFHADLEEDQS